MKRIELAGITVALFILLFCGMGIKANCQEKNRLSQITDMNKDIERGYLQEVREGLELNSETIKKLDNCFDSEIVSKLFFEITDAVIDKKEAVEIEKLINEKIK